MLVNFSKQGQKCTRFLFTKGTYYAIIFTFDTFVPEQIEMVFLRRGVIGVSKVGYIK